MAEPSITAWVTAPNASTQSLQAHGGIAFAEFIQRPDQLLGRPHHIHHQRHFRFQARGQSARLGEQAVQRDGEAARVRQDRAPRIGQLGPGGAGTGEQGDAQLALQIGDGIADHRIGAAQLAGSPGKAAGLHNRQEDRDLVQSGGFGVQLFNFLE